MNKPPLLSPKMLTALSGFYPSVATIESAGQAADSYGDPVATWTTFASPIPCVVAARSVDQRLSSDSVHVVHSTYIALQGHYPLVTDAMRVTVDGAVWNILGVEHDSHGKTTRLQVVRA